MLRELPFVIIVILAFIGGCRGGGNVVHQHGQIALPNAFVNAEIQVESQGNNKAIGDHGQAIGCLQIHEACFDDAWEYLSNSKVSGDYQNCFDRDFSIKIMTAYLNRYCRDAISKNDFETMARTWNGGPNGKKSDSTLGYWRKVKAALEH